MAFNVSGFHDNAGIASTPVVPDASIGVFSRVLPAGGNMNVVHGRTTTGAVYGPADYQWIIVMRPIVSWNFTVDQGVGAATTGITLAIFISHGDGTYEKLWRQYALHLGEVNVMAGLFIPGWMARFNLIDKLGDDVHNVEGFIKIQGLL